MPNILYKIYDNVCEKLLNIYIYFMIYLGCSVGSKKEVDSFIVTKNDIEILDITKEIDKDNLNKYLRHHIMCTDDIFHPMYFFDGPLLVRFKYQNEIYQICLKQLESKNTDHTMTNKEPKFLSAVIKIHENDQGKCITEKLVELHGPDRNFFNHIPDTISDLPILLKDYRGKLHIFDMMGNQKIHEL